VDGQCAEDVTEAVIVCSKYKPTHLLLLDHPG
jgi:hypothetical protein